MVSDLPPDAHHRPTGIASGDTSRDERAELISAITTIQNEMVRAFARARSMPLLASTLTTQQLRVVIFLSLTDSTSGQELANQLGIGLGTITGIVDRLVAQDLVERHEDPADRRVRRLQLSTAGRRLVDEITDARSAGFREILSELDTQALRDLDSVMRKINQVVENRNQE